MLFSVFTELYNFRQHLISEHFCLLRQETTRPLVIALPLSPQPQATTNLLSVSKDLSPLNTSYQWTCSTCGLACLASFTSHVAARSIPSFLSVAKEHSVVWFFFIFDHKRVQTCIKGERLVY